MREKWRMHVQEHHSGQQAQRAMMLLDDISLAVREMQKFGIDWADFHSENMMRDSKGLLRISDVGFGIPRQNFDVEPPDFSMQNVEAYLEVLRAAVE